MRIHSTQKIVAIVFVSCLLIALVWWRYSTGTSKTTTATISSQSTPFKGNKGNVQGRIGTIKAGHLVGVCTASLIVAHRQGFFREEGLDVEPQWTQNPGDAITLLDANAIQFWNGSFTATNRAVELGSKLKIVAGAGNQGLCVLVHGDSGIQSMDDLAKRAKTGLRVGTQRLNTLELTLYGALADKGLSYDDFEMKFFTDHFTMSNAFQSRELDVISHVEPYASQLVAQTGARILTTSAEVWGPGSADCVTIVRTEFLEQHPEAVKRYIRAMLRADAFIKANHDKAVDIMVASKVWKANREHLSLALHNQPPGVDLRPAVKGMDRALSDMVKMGYLKSKPDGVVDLTLLEELIKEAKK